MRTMTIIAAVLSALLAVACSANYADGRGAAAKGTCDGACEHYLTCKGSDNTQNRQTCVASCGQKGLSADQLRQFEQQNCATAIAQVENNAQGGGGGGGGSGSSSGGSDCNGCVWDGSSCTWYSQSNWGAGAYSGAAISCEARCCQ